MGEADAAAPLEVVIFTIGANVNFPLLETGARKNAGYTVAWPARLGAGTP
jgi:hypothetical protein